MTLSQRFTELEAIIDVGLATFIDVGHALTEIRDSRLYREHGFDRFEDYCDQRWKPRLSRSRAYELIAAARVVDVVSGIPDTEPPANEAQANELAALARSDPQAAATLWDQVRTEKGDGVTARDVREAVRQHQGKLPVRRERDLDAYQPDPDSVYGPPGFDPNDEPSWWKEAFAQQAGGNEPSSPAIESAPPLIGPPKPNLDAGIRWTRSMHSIFVDLNSIRDLGGILCLTSKWPPGQVSGYLTEIRRLVEVLQGFERELEGRAQHANHA